MVNRTQALVLGFFVVALVSLLAILVAAPEVYDQALRLPAGSRVAEIAFLAGVLRVPVAILQLTGVLSADVPAWYVSENAQIVAGGTCGKVRTTRWQCRWPAAGLGSRWL